MKKARFQAVLGVRLFFLLPTSVGSLVPGRLSVTSHPLFMHITSPAGSGGKIAEIVFLQKVKPVSKEVLYVELLWKVLGKRKIKTIKNLFQSYRKS